MRKEVAKHIHDLRVTNIRLNVVKMMKWILLRICSMQYLKRLKLDKTATCKHRPPTAMAIWKQNILYRMKMVATV